MKRFLLLVLLLFIITIQDTFAQNIIINELMSNNQNFLLDEDGDDSDWIEIYNNSSSDINLQGYFLSDKAEDLQLWAFPNITLAAGDFLLVFASGKNKIDPTGELHSNFSLKSSGENLFLSFGATIIHTAPAIPLAENTSYGLSSDGIAPFQIYNSPSPYASNNTTNGQEVLQFSHRGGIYPDTFTLSITGNSQGTTIRYTTDGTKPNVQSNIYSASLPLDNSFQSQANISQIQNAPSGQFNTPDVEDVLKPLVIRAAVFDTQGNRLSDIHTHSYFIQSLGIHHENLPILSISAEYDDLFNHETGIFIPGIHWDETNPDWTGNYHQRGRDWEKEVFVEFYESDNTIGFRQDVGLRIHGGNSRRDQQKGMRLYARSDYGVSKFNYQIYPSKNIESYNRIVLKPFSSTWTNGGVEDFLSNQYASTLNIDHLATRPVIVYLNGEYWGIYYFQEKVDDDYIGENYNLHKDSFDIIEHWGGYAAHNSNHEFHIMYEFIETNDMTSLTNYNKVLEWMDIDNFIDYQLYQIFMGNRDWPTNNVKLWQPNSENGKFRWIFFDGDATMYRLRVNGFEQALGNDENGGEYPETTLVFRKLLENEMFKARFLNRLEYLLQNQLHPDATLPLLGNIISLLKDDIHRQIARFEAPSSYDYWNDVLENVRYFLVHRPCNIQEQVKELFNEELQIADCIQPLIHIENIKITPNPNLGIFKIDFHASETSSGKILITNSMGQILNIKNEVFSEGMNEFYFENLNLPNGILFVHLIIGDRTFRAKMIRLGN